MRRLTRTRAATLVEYTLIIVAVLLLAAGSYKLLGGKLGTRSNTAGDVVAGEGAPKGGGGGGGAGAGGGGGGGGGGKANVASKVSVGGMGNTGENGGGNASTRDTSSENATGANSNTRDSGGNADVAETFTPKRWMGIGLLVAGLIAIGYVVSSMRRSKKAADAMGPQDAPAGRRRK